LDCHFHVILDHPKYYLLSLCFNLSTKFKHFWERISVS